MRRAPFLILSLILAVSGAGISHAVEQVPADTYYTDDPIDTNSPNIPGWSIGWAQPASQPAGYTYTTGWNYVGRVGNKNASGVYLGNGWVLTAAHVNNVPPGPFYLNGSTFTLVPGSAQLVGNADLRLFQIESPPALPALTLSSTDPAVYNPSFGTGGSNVAMIGYGDGGAIVNESWGYNRVTDRNESVTVGPYTSNDFLTATGTLPGTNGPTNTGQVVTGDSGGGDFIYDSSEQKWQLAGINEVTGTLMGGPYNGDDASGFVQLDTYAAQIDAITGVPEPRTWLLVSLGLGLVWGGQRYRQKRLRVGTQG